MRNTKKYNKTTLKFKTMNIENNLRLFTRVEDGLPKGEVLSYSEVSKESLVGYIQKGERFCFTESDDILLEEVTHWLDLSKLTTKDRAIELAADAYSTGWNDYHEIEQGGSESTFENFINENKERL
jgi:hypothetical protein